jgi:hypothetical protein
LLVHQLPPRPLYLRAKIRARLAKVGAAALKSSVYALPRQEDCLEDFDWIAEEARAGGGDAWICVAEFPDRKRDADLVARFQADRDADYAALLAELREARGQPDLAPRLTRARKRLDEIERIDFFSAKGRAAVEELLHALHRRLEGRETMRRGTRKPDTDLVGRTWVTRPGVKVDRISSAWFVRRFVDPKARFRFLDPKKEEPRPGEIGFDMAGGKFTHEGDRCTLEMLVRRTAVRDAALRPITEIVHDIDLKDGKFGRPETPGIARLLAGVLASSPDDPGRLDRGFLLFDDLYASYRAATPSMRRRRSAAEARASRDTTPRTREGATSGATAFRPPARRTRR